MGRANDVFYHDPRPRRSSPPACYDRQMPCDPLRDLRAWQERLERLATQHTTSWAPPIDIYETVDKYVITAEVPGLAREQIDVAIEDKRITLRGARPGA